MNLPNKKVNRVILGEKYRTKLEIPLKKRQIDCIFLSQNKEIEWQINSHADIQIIHIKDDIWVCEPSISVDFKVLYGQTVLKNGYPHNISYNGLVMGNHFFHNLKYTDKKILTSLTDVNIHNVKQGFAKCSVLVLGEKLAITSDNGMYKALENEKIQVLLIKEGHINLEGYNYGFIGGAGFKTDKNTICFTGRLDNHPNYNDIVQFITKNNMQIDYLTDEKIFDVGSILPIFY